MKNTNAKTLFSVLFALVLLAGTVSASQLTLYAGWNMISPNDDGFTASAISNACSQSGSIWHYDGSNYVRQTGTLEAGKGYWVRVNSQCTVNTNGNPYTVSSISLNSGWNQIGISSLSGAYSSLSTCSIQGGPWHYDTSSNSYQRSDISSLIAGKGYWVKVPSSCALSFGDSPPQPPSDENSSLDRIMMFSSTFAITTNEVSKITVYSYDVDGSFATPQEGTTVSATISPANGASISGFAYDGSKYTATFTASKAGNYQIYATVHKGGIYKSSSVSMSVRLAQENGTALGVGETLDTAHFKVRLSDVLNSNSANFDILDSNSNLLRQVAVQSGSTYIYGLQNYSVSIRLHEVRYSQGINDRTAYVSISESQIGNNREPLGYIAYWYGKVNQHKSPGGSWLTDSDGVSGADISQLTYCQKFFPGTLGVNEIGRTYIGNWKNRGNTEQFGEYGVEYECLPYSYYRVVTNLRPPANEVGTAAFATTPSGANIVVKQDDRTMAYGTTPYSVRLQYGTYTLVYSKAGYYNYTTSVYFNERTHTYSAALQAQQQTLGQVAYWHGKYSQYRTNDGSWQSDASRGAETDQLAYCQQKFSGVLGVNEVSSSYISNWRDASGRTYNGYGIVYDCLSYAYRSTPTNLRPQTQGTAMHLYDELQTQRFRVRLYDVSSSPAAQFDILDSNGNMVAGSISVSPGSNYTYAQRGTNYGVNIRVYSADFAAGKTYGYKWADVSATEVTVANSEPLGYIAYWSGKVNQHRSPNGQWQTDSDGTSGSGIGMLEYCKKFFPQATDAASAGNTYISGWKNYGNTGNFNGSGAVYSCIQR